MRGARGIRDDTHEHVHQKFSSSNNRILKQFQFLQQKILSKFLVILLDLQFYGEMKGNYENMSDKV